MFRITLDRGEYRKSILFFMFISCFNFYLSFWPYHIAFGILVPWPGIEPGPYQWKSWVLAPGPLGNSFFSFSFSSIYLFFLKKSWLDHLPYNNLMLLKILKKWLHTAFSLYFINLAELPPPYSPFPTMGCVGDALGDVALAPHLMSHVAWVQFSSVQLLKSCLTLCDPMNRSMPGLPVHHQLPEFTQTHVHQVGDAIQPSYPLSSPSPPAPIPPG